MQKNHLLFSLLTLLSLLTSTEVKGEGGVVSQRPQGVPRLVVNIMVDQLQSDYLEAFSPLYGSDGLQLLLQKGRVYLQADYPFVARDEASAAATVATGAAPSEHGVVALQWLNRDIWRPQRAVDDRSVKGLYTAEGCSPRQLEASTVADELKVSTGGRAWVVSIAPDSESAIFQAGHAADQVVWIDDNTGNWASSSYYGEFPKWADYRNVYQNLDYRLQSLHWQPLVPRAPFYWTTSQRTSTFAHKLKGPSRFAAFKSSALVNSEIAAAVGSALQGTYLGSDDIPDYLAITLYAGPFSGKNSLTGTAELQDTYARLDRAVAEIIAGVHKKVGEGNALFTLTSTGYCAENEEEERAKYRLPIGQLDMRRTVNLLGMYLVALYGQGNYIAATMGNQIYLNHRLLDERQINVPELQTRVQEFLQGLTGVKEVVSAHRLQNGAWSPEMERAQKNFYAQRSGDFILRLRPGWHVVNADYPGHPLSQMAFVRFPIFLYGTGVVPQKVETPVTVDRIAPTLSKALRIRAPSACRQLPLF